LFSLEKEMAWDGAISSGDGSDGDGEQDTVPKILGDTGGSDVASGEINCVKAGEKEPTSLDPKPKKRVASEKMKATLLRARTAKAEKRRSRTKQPTSQPQPQFFFDIV
jgi:hypothetical protein